MLTDNEETRLNSNLLAYLSHHIFKEQIDFFMYSRCLPDDQLVCVEDIDFSFSAGVSPCFRLDCFLDNKDPDRVFLQAFLGNVENLSLAEFAVSHPDTPVYNPPPGAELVPWLKEGLSELHEKIPVQPNMELDGIEAVRISTSRSEMAPSYDDIYLILNGKMFNIKLLEPDFEENAELYNQMLSTFRFDR